MKSRYNHILVAICIIFASAMAFAQDTSLVVTSTGNVGVGLTNPLEKLHVNGSIYLNSGVGSLRIHHSGTNVGWKVSTIGGGSNLTFIDQPASGNGSNRVTFSAEGFVGIGTTAPTSALDVVGDTHVSGKITSGAANVSLPIAYGVISASGTLINGTSNLSVNYDAASNRYLISISGHNIIYSLYVTQVTPVGGGSSISVATDSISGNLVVYLYDAAGAPIQKIFQVVVFQI